MKFRVYYSRAPIGPRTQGEWEGGHVAIAQPDVAEGWSAEGKAGDFILDMRGTGWTFLRLSPEPDE